MALFLTESFASKTVITMQEAFEAVIEMKQEQANLTEALLKADFVIHEKSRVLREAGDDAGAKKSEEGFFARVWAAIKEMAAKVWQKIKDVVAYIRRKASEFGAWIAAKYAGVKSFVVRNYKYYSTKVKLAAAMVLEAIKGKDADPRKIAELKAQLAALKKDDAETVVSDSELEGHLKASAALAEDAEKAAKAGEAAAAAAPEDKAAVDSVKSGIAAASEAAQVGTEAAAAASSAKPKKK